MVGTCNDIKDITDRMVTEEFLDERFEQYHSDCSDLKLYYDERIGTYYLFQQCWNGLYKVWDSFKKQE